VRHPWPPCLAVLAIAVLAAVGALRLRLSIRDADQLPQAHPYVSVYNEINETFGGGWAVIVAVVPRHGDVFRPEVLEKIARITARLEAMPELARGSVWSIAAERVKRLALVDGELDVRQLMPAVPRMPADVAQLRHDVFADPRFVGTLVSRDGGAAAVIADFPPGIEPPAIVQSIEKVVAPERDATTAIVLAGSPVVLAAVDRATAQMAILFPLAVLVIGLVHYEAFRTVQAMVLPLVTALLSVACALGAMGWLGLPVDTWSAVTPVAILAIAAGHAVQILKRYYEDYAVLGNSRAAVISSIGHTGPVMVTAGLIAASGFASLATFHVTSVRVFGLLMAFGILSALVIEMTFIPAVRALMAPPRPRERLRAGSGRWLGSSLAGLARRVVERPGVVLMVAALLVAAALPGTRFVYVDNSLRELFPPSSPMRRADAIVNTRLAGSSTMRILVAGDTDGVIEEPEVLRAIDDLQRFLERDPQVGATTSIVDYLRQMDRVMRPDDHDPHALPATRNLAAQYLFLYSLSGSDDLRGLIDAGERRAAILAYTKSDESAFAERLFRTTREFVEQRFRGLPVRVGIGGGSLGAQAAMNEVVVHEKIRNVVQVSAIIVVLSALALRSVVGGLLVLVPLLVSVVLTAGIMGWTGIWLGMSTSAVLAMGVSIGADFALYLIFRLREELRSTSYEDGVRRALVTSGTAIFFVSSAVAFGYLVLVASGFQAWVHLGGLTALMMVLSSLAAMTLVPALVILLRPRFLRASMEEAARR
jgi:uncharacterized protein